MTQTISGLACGRPIRGNVAFLGGPLQYLSELRHRFYLTLNLDEEHRIVPQNAHLFVASGAAMAHESNKLSTFPQLIEAIDALGDTQVPRSSAWIRSLPPTRTLPSSKPATTRKSFPRASSKATPAACSLASTPAPPP